MDFTDTTIATHNSYVTILQYSYIFYWTTSKYNIRNINLASDMRTYDNETNLYEIMNCFNICGDYKLIKHFFAL